MESIKNANLNRRERKNAKYKISSCKHRLIVIIIVFFVIKNIFVIPSIRIIVRSKKHYVKVGCKIERSKISGKHCWHSDSVVCVNRVNDKTSGQPCQSVSQRANQSTS